MDKGLANSHFAAKLTLIFKKEEDYVTGFLSYEHHWLRRTLLRLVMLFSKALE